MVLTALVMVIPLIFGSLSIILPSNTRLGSVPSAKVAKFSVVSEAQFSNADAPILVVVAGTVTLVILSQLSKAFSPIPMQPDGIVIAPEIELPA